MPQEQLTGECHKQVWAVDNSRAGHSEVRDASQQLCRQVLMVTPGPCKPTKINYVATTRVEAHESHVHGLHMKTYAMEAMSMACTCHAHEGTLISTSHKAADHHDHEQVSVFNQKSRESHQHNRTSVMSHQQLESLPLRLRDVATLQSVTSKTNE